MRATTPGHRIALALILLLAAALRWHHLGQQSLWIDEITAGTAARIPLGEFLSHVRSDSAAGPLDYVGIRFVTSMLGHGTLATRFWAFVVGCAAIPVSYLVGSRLFASRRVGLVAALLLAFSAFHIYYSQEARFYSLTVLVGLLNLYVFNRALQRGRRRDWLFFGGVATLAFYTHYFLAMLLPIEAAFLAGYWSWRWASARFGREVLRDGLRQVCLFAGAILGALLLFAPWIWFAAAYQFQWRIGSVSALPPLDYTLLRETITDLLALPPAGERERALAFGVIGLAALGLLLSLWARRAQSLILLAAIVVAMPAAWAADRLGNYFFAERQVIFILPFVYLLAAAGITFPAVAAGKWVSRLELLPTHGGWVGRAASRLGAPGAALALAVLWGLFNWGSIEKVYAGHLQSKEDWRGAAAFIAASNCPGARYYTNVSDHYQYGIVYYQARLESQTRWLHGTLGYWEHSLPAAVSALDFDDRDWIAVLSFAAGGDAADLVHATLTQQGWLYREFPDQRLRVYYRVLRPGCLTNAGSGSRPASSGRSELIWAGPQPR